MKIGICGLSASGKSTVFNALSGQGIATGIPTPPQGDRHVAAVSVPDPRLEKLRDIYQPKKFTLSQVEFTDFPGIPLEDAKGKGELMADIRAMDALVLVLRDFESEMVAEDRAPASELSALRAEFLLADMAMIEKRIERLEVSVKKPTKTQDRDKKELEILRRCQDQVEAEKEISELNFDANEEEMIRGFRFLTQKPLVAVINTADEVSPDLVASLDKDASVVEAMNAKIEEEIAQIDEEERTAFLADFGIDEPATGRILRAIYEASGLHSFFTVGEDEVRSWAIHLKDNAVTAASKIHSDIARGFIRAEVVGYGDFMDAGDMKAAKANNKSRLEGKEYVVEDGDIINFRFSV
ncbi:MAG: DUF933 domain-containing protein [Planctomycetota bacterium]